MSRAPATAAPAAPSPPARRGRTTGAFLVVAAALFVLIAGANLPTPLYAVYRERFGFSATVLTLVFTTYAFVLVGALVVCGQLSDRLGRRRVIVAGLAVAAVGLGVFAAAQGTAWLFAGRALQGHRDRPAGRRRAGRVGTRPADALL